MWKYNTKMRYIPLAMVIILFFPSVYGINVVVSIPDFEPIVREIGGKDVNISILLPPGTDPHSFSITEKDVEKIKNADIIMLANSNLLSYEKAIKSNYNKEYLDFPDYEKNGAVLLDFGDFQNNPHGYWLYVNNSIAIASTICEKLSEIFPDKKDFFNSSLNKFKETLGEAENNTMKMMKENNLYGKKVVAMVPGVCYIARNMGLDADEILLAEGTASVSPQKLQHVKEGLRKGEYAMIIVPSFLKDAKAGEIARQIARDTNSSVAYVKFATGGNSYINIFYYNSMEVISAGNRKVEMERYDAWMFYLIALLLLLAVVEGILIYECRRIK